jgi:hypothetical protein
MSVGTAAAAGAAAAAANERQEEEHMTPYSTHDLAENWEFKILRNSFATFRDPQKLKAVLDEEKQGGWVLVEKFDDYRIRLKRPSGTKTVQGDFADQYDPYRTTVGPSQEKRTAIVLGAITFFLFMVMFLAAMMRYR